MALNISKALRKTSDKIRSSIAFVPAIMAIVFLLLSVLMIEFDFSETGKHLKATARWMRLRDTDTARTMVSSILGGLISLTVFSFSMVMILLNQAASQLSNRTLESMISKRFHQIVLGFYLGSIVYSLSVLTTIRDIESGIYVPALSIYLLLLFTVTDVFFFIYFLHYVTQQVKYQTIIKDIHERTFKVLKKVTDGSTPFFQKPASEAGLVTVPESNYYQGFSRKQLVHFAKKHNAVVQILHPPGTYLLAGMPLLAVYGAGPLGKADNNEILSAVDMFKGQPIDKNFFYGFHQLAEGALKALSPGINDPQTAVLSLHALTDLFSYLLSCSLKEVYTDDEKTVRVHAVQRSPENIFKECFYPIWDYGKDDHYIQENLQAMMLQLQHSHPGRSFPYIDKLLQLVENQRKKTEY